jgi:hypothetical protein
VVAACGTVIFDRQPSLRYRQHSLSSVGAQAGRWARMRGKVSRQLRGYSPDSLFDQAIDLQRRYGDVLEPSRRRKLEDFLSFRARWFQPRVFGSDAFERQYRLDDVLLRLMLVFRFRGS